MRFSDKLRNLMDGRNGNDNLNRFLSIVCLILLVISIITGKNIIFWIALAILVLTYGRMLSRNVYARREENEKYLEIKDKVLSFFNRSGGSSRRSYDPAYKYYTCPNCKKKLRVPSGKGRIEICCPNCQKKFIKRT